MSIAFQVFELSEVADAVGMDTEKAKNWTVGRPLRIEPSIRAGRGKGSRNLYSIEDVYRMGLAYELSRAGVSPGTIRQVLQKLSGKFLAGEHWIRCWRSNSEKPDLSVQLGRSDPPYNVLVWQTISLGKLVSRINERISKGGQG